MSRTPSVAAQVAVVCDAADAQGVGLAMIVTYAGAVYRAAVGAVPAHHGPAVAAAEAEVGEEWTAAAAEWVATQRGWIDTAAAALDALRELGPPLREVPAGALAAAAVAQLLAEAAGDPLAEVIWTGTCAAAQWQMRYGGEEVRVNEMRTADPLADAAYRRLADEECLRIATGVRATLSTIDELAAG